MTKVTVSTKYQIVIPKAVRRKLDIKPGQKINVDSVDGKITLQRVPTMQELLDRGAGTLQDSPWQKANMDPAEWIRQQRDAEWD